MTDHKARPSSVVSHGRLSNIPIAARRLEKVWAKGMSATTARRFMTLWPVWTGGVLLSAVCAIGLDAPSVEWVRGLPRPVTASFQWVTDFGKSGWLLVPFALLCLILLFCDWRTVSRRAAAAWTEIGLIVGFAFMSIAGAGIVSNIIKQTIGRGRPVVFDRDGAFSLMPFRFDYAQASFPSGHATTMGALAVAVAVIAPRARWPVFAACVFVASTRVFVAAHYPSDVVAGFLLGAAFCWFLALALAQAGIALARECDGTIKTRAVAVRHLFLRPGGFSVAMGSLWLAIFGLGLPTAAV